jgi:hypothetical protein
MLLRLIGRIKFKSKSKFNVYLDLSLDSYLILDLVLTIFSLDKNY